MVAGNIDPADTAGLKLGLPPRMVLGLASGIVAILLIASLAYAALRQQSESRASTQHTLDVIAGLNEAMSQAKDAETGQRGFLLTGKEEYVQPFTLARTAVLSQLDSLGPLLVDNPTQLQRLQSMRQLLSQKMDEMQQTIELQRSGRSSEALTLVNTDRGKSLMDEVRNLAGAMIAEEQGLLASRSTSLAAAQWRSFAVILGGLLLLLVLLLVAGLLAAREVDRRETEIWLRAGQAALAGALQSELRLEMLGEHVLRFMTRQAGAAAGALYVMATGRTLRRVAGYALGTQAPHSFELGEGLVGEAARSDRIAHLADVPAQHLRIESTLVSGSPRHIVLVPVSYNGRVNAVLELGMTTAPQLAQLELLERTRGVLGTAVNASIDRSRLEELLEETQRQSEELQTQQEELRVANEELTEQSQALRESSARLEQQQAELEQTNSQLEEQTRSLEEHSDRLMRGEQELRERSADLQRANDYKSEFLANMSHELRTPLNSSLILAKLLADNRTGNLNEEQVRFAQTIQSAGNDLLALINDILDLSKIEAGKMEIQRENVSVQRLLDNLSEGFTEVANSKGLRFVVSTAPGTLERIESDSQRVLQILRNLLSNAFKFTAAGEVTLQVASVASASGPGLAFAVRDTGIGIAPEQQSTIFEAFRQADGSTHRKYGGTGLGLSISRDLAALLGGEITIDSKMGAGSTFTLWLPERAPEQAAVHKPGGGATAALREWAKAVPAAAPLVPPPAKSSPRSAAAGEELLGAPARVMLVIEDDVAFSGILRDLAREQGFETIVAHTAGEGLAVARSQRISAVLLDMHLPDRTGLSVLDELKRDPATRHIPVHVLSVADYSHEALSRGAVGYALKPVDREQVVGALQRLDARLSPGLRRVLVVEDDARQRESVRQLLASEGVEIIPAETAARALELLRQQTFDCMVLDLNLPDLSGYELLEQMGELDGVGYPPVIVYTGRSLNRDEEQSLRRFSRSIIVKDARSPERLLDEVTLFLHQVESKLPPESQRMLRAVRDREEALDGRRILVVEDDVRNIFALSKLLEPRGARVDIARNGREALEHLQRTAGSGEAPDLVLMDIMMPEMDGLTATREIRKNPQWKRLPIIALTAKAMRDDQEKCLLAGASDYLAKPLDVERLLSLIRVWMPK
ncbi:MAG: response regulator [Steroidobacteraceae bacterium]